MDDERPLSHGKYKSGGSKKRANSELGNGRHKRRNTNDGHDAKTIDTIYRILCPIKKIGSVLGKGGDIVNALRKDTHAKIRVVDAIPGADERAIIIFSYTQQEAEGNNKRQNNVSDDPFGSENLDMKLHCPAQDALLKIHDRIAADEYMRGGVVHENTEPQDDVMARILVPKIQVGCLLGKGGNVIQKLRQDTNAHIRILPSRDLPPCAMRSDELVQISGNPINVRRALFEISTLLHLHPRKDNPPLEDILSASAQHLYQSGPEIPPPLSHGNPILSRHTPPTSWFDGYRNELSSHGPSSFNYGSERNGVLEDFSIKILCATEKIGSVIGKSGANVRQLEKQTGARIHVEGTDPDAKERVIVISSKEALSNPISPAIEAVLQLRRRTSDVPEKGTITTRLLVSSSKIGCLLGKGGDVITEMRRRTHADIHVFSKSDKPKYASDDEELVQISGNESVAETALLEIVSRLRAKSLQGGIIPLDPLAIGPGRGFAPSENFSGRARQPSAVIGSTDLPFHDYPMGYDYPKVSDYSKSYDHQQSYDYPKGYDHSKVFNYPKDYNYRKSYDYPKDYDYPVGSDYTESYDYPKDAGRQFNSHGYPGPEQLTGYSEGRRSPMEVKTLRMGGNNVSNVHHQAPPNASWRYKDHPRR